MRSTAGISYVAPSTSREIGIRMVGIRHDIALMHCRSLYDMHRSRYTDPRVADCFRILQYAYTSVEKKNSPVKKFEE